MLICYYTADDRPYTLPASSTADLTVIAGHTSRRFAAAFNALYDWRQQRFAVRRGDRLLLRTKSSGADWLVYRAVSFHTPPRDGLATDTSVWGTGAQPNRLLTIGCLQPSNPNAPSTRNIVVTWRYVGVR